MRVARQFAAARFVFALGLLLLPNSGRRCVAEPLSAAAAVARVKAHSFQPLVNGFTLDPGAGKQGVADLGDQSWRIKLVALRDLARLGPEKWREIAGLAKDANPHVRDLACIALGALLISDARPSLEETLREDPEPVVRSSAAVALGRLALKESAGSLKQALAEDKSRDVRHQAELALHRVEHSSRGESELGAAYAALDEKAFGSLRIGAPAPDFELKDTRDRPWRLSQFKGKQAVVLIWIFADWCPVCHGEFRDLIELREKFAESGAQVFTIECHDRFRSRVMAGDEKINPDYWFTKQSPQPHYASRIWWPHLVDLAGGAGARFGVAPMEFAVHSEFVNRPATIIVDEDGIVRFAYYGTYWGDRPTVEETLGMLQSGNFVFEHPKRLKIP